MRRFPLERVVDRPREVASLPFTTAELAEASPRIASALVILELTFDEALREGSAGGFLALPLLRVLCRERPVAEILGAAEVRLALRTALMIRVLEDSVVHALEESVARVARVPGLVAGGAERIIAVRQALSNVADDEAIAFIDGVHGGPRKIEVLSRVGTADVRAAALAIRSVISRAIVEVANNESHVMLELIREPSKERRVIMNKLNAIAPLIEVDLNPAHITKAFLVDGGVKLGRHIECMGGVDLVVRAGSVTPIRHANLLPRLCLARAIARIANTEGRGEAVLVGLHELNAGALRRLSSIDRVRVAAWHRRVDQVEASGARALDLGKVDGDLESASHVIVVVRVWKLSGCRVLFMNP